MHRMVIPGPSAQGYQDRLGIGRVIKLVWNAMDVKMSIVGCKRLIITI